MTDLPRTPNPTYIVTDPDLTDAEYVERVLASCRTIGCTCNPDITITRDADGPNIHHHAVAHDDWCPLLERKRHERTRLASPHN